MGGWCVLERGVSGKEQRTFWLSASGKPADDMIERLKTFFCITML